MPPKPTGVVTPNAASALCPDTAILCHEGTGIPFDIGKTPLNGGIGTMLAGAASWTTLPGMGIAFQLDGVKRVGYGLSALLGGLTKFTIVCDFLPTTWFQTGSFLSKQSSWGVGNVFTFGLAFISSYGYRFQAILGNSSKDNAGVSYQWQPGAWGESSGVPTEAQWILDYDSTRAAFDRFRLYRNNVLLGTETPRIESALTVTTDTAVAIEIGQGASEIPTQGTLNGKLGYLYVYRDKVLSAQERADLFLDPYQWTNQATAVVSVSPQVVIGYEKTLSTIPIPAVFRISRSGSTTGALSVPFTLTGSGVGGVDYVIPTSPAVIPSGQSFVDINITPILDNSQFKHFNTVILTPNVSGSYSLPANPSATVFLRQIQYDAWGGIVGARSPNGAMANGAPVADGLGWWRTEKYQNRWLWVSPGGNYCWLKSVETVYGHTGRYIASQWYRYTGVGGSSTSLPFQWYNHTCQRLLDWGFNTLGMNADNHIWPIATNGQGSYVNPENYMPFILTPGIGIHGYSIRSLAPTPAFDNNVLDIMAACTPATHGLGGYYGDFNQTGFPDVFDPKFELAAYDILAHPAGVYGEGQWTPIPVSDQLAGRWFKGIAFNETDNDRPFKTQFGQNLGLVALISAPTVGSRTNFSKKRMIEVLRTRYNNDINALNTAWALGSIGNNVPNYTSFDSTSQGWPKATTGGRGLMDEDGSSLWLRHGGSIALNSGADSPAIAADISALFTDFLNADQDAMIKALGRIGDTPILPSGPGTPRQAFIPNLPLWTDQAVSPIVHTEVGLKWQDPRFNVHYWGAGRHFPAGSGTNYADYAAVIAALSPTVRTQIGDKAWTWYGFLQAPGDSPWAYDNPDVTAGGTPGFNPVEDNEGNFFVDHAAMGAAYEVLMDNLWDYQNADGTHPWAGMQWWNLQDSAAPGDITASGLVTCSGNAYDGEEATIGGRGGNNGTDRFGVLFSTGGEYKNFGDLITPVRRANFKVDQRILAMFQSGVTPSPNLTGIPYVAGTTDVTGTGTPGATVTVYVNAVSAGTTAVAGGGTWTKAVTALVTGNIVTAKQTISGVDSALSNPSTVIGGSITAPVVNAIIEAQTIITGTGVANATLTLERDTVAVATAIVSSLGNWSITLAPGVVLAGQIFRARQSDGVNISSYSSTVTVGAIGIARTQVYVLFRDGKQVKFILRAVVPPSQLAQYAAFNNTTRMPPSAPTYTTDNIDVQSGRVTEKIDSFAITTALDSEAEQEAEMQARWAIFQSQVTAVAGPFKTRWDGTAWV